MRDLTWTPKDVYDLPWAKMSGKLFQDRGKEERTGDPYNVNTGGWGASATDHRGPYNSNWGVTGEDTEYHIRDFYWKLKVFFNPTNINLAPSIGWTACLVIIPMGKTQSLLSSPVVRGVNTALRHCADSGVDTGVSGVGRWRSLGGWESNPQEEEQGRAWPRRAFYPLWRACWVGDERLADVRILALSLTSSVALRKLLLLVSSSTKWGHS